MKTIPLLIIAITWVWAYNSKTGQERASADNAMALTGTVNFKTQVQPVMEKNCSPCHFPGGKLYQKLPFDNGEIIIAHKAAILKRIKNDEEVNMIRRYGAQIKVVK